MVKKLFWDDPYLTSCLARVTAIEHNTVQVHQTVFFAPSGGQAADSGTIGGIKVIDAQEKEDSILYTLEKPPTFLVGDAIEIRIDADHRDTLRRLHSAVHVLSKLLTSEIIGSSVHTSKGRLDIASDQPMDPEPLNVQLNRIIAMGQPVLMRSDHAGKRLWHCGSWDIPCSGTHVKNLSEIGPVMLKRLTKGAGKERLEIYLQAEIEKPVENVMDGMLH